MKFRQDISERPSTIMFTLKRSLWTPFHEIIGLYHAEIELLLQPLFSRNPGKVCSDITKTFHNCFHVQTTALDTFPCRFDKITRVSRKNSIIFALKRSRFCLYIHGKFVLTSPRSNEAISSSNYSQDVMCQETIFNANLNAGFGQFHSFKNVTIFGFDAS